MQFFRIFLKIVQQTSNRQINLQGNPFPRHSIEKQEVAQMSDIKI